MENNNTKQLQFNIITPDMRAEVEKYIAASGIQSSEYTFTTSMMWGAEGKITIAFEDGMGFEADPADTTIAVGVVKGSELTAQINAALADISEEQRVQIMADALAAQPSAE